MITRTVNFMSTDEMNILKYLIIIELVLLLLSQVLGGRTALIWVTLLSCIVVCSGYIFIISLGSHAPATKVIFTQLLQFLALFIYLAIGVWAFFSSSKIMTLFSYVWLVSVVIFTVTLFIDTYVPSELSLQLKEERQYKQRLKVEEARGYAIAALEQSFNTAYNDVNLANDFITSSQATAKKYQHDSLMSYHFANYTAKLMIQFMRVEEYSKAEEIFNSYTDILVPQVGLHTKSSDVASNAIILAFYLNDMTLISKVHYNVLGDNMDVETIDNSLLHFNLACFYAITRDKEKLILHITIAREQGYDKESFYSDKDFSSYKDDKDFILAVEGESK